MIDAHPSPLRRGGSDLLLELGICRSHALEDVAAPFEFIRHVRRDLNNVRVSLVPLLLEK